ncbi:uncharacterized protein [Procambarus clarkii]|uniref:uncharacterized protein n=1 Tax=Procambarus clarkii TaxID=6728 RepID=UPI003744457F
MISLVYAHRDHYGGTLKHNDKPDLATMKLKLELAKFERATTSSSPNEGTRGDPEGTRARKRGSLEERRSRNEERRERKEAALREREAVVLRFCYSLDATNINDAPPAQLAAHIQQLTPLLQTYAGVIAVLQAGFIGVWGEWYYTANYGNNGVVTSQDWYKRTQVVNQLLQALPASRQIQLRTPYYKQKILERTSPIISSEAFTNTLVARIGQHNDCFLASDTDFGTYVNKAMAYPYLKNETLYLSMGGETCANNPPRSSCPTALQEMAELHYRFLNVDYIQVVLDAWRTQGCFNTVLLLLPDGDSQLRNRPEYNIVISNMIYSDSPGRRLNLVGSFNAVP